MRMQLDGLLRPRRIAIVGASPNSGVAKSITRSLEMLRFPGEVYLVNPRYAEVFGRKTYPSLLELPASPDVVAFAVNNQTILDSFPHLPQISAKAAVIYGGGFGETSEAGVSLQREIADICLRSDIALCGPNCLGVFSPAARSSTFFDELGDASGVSGNVAIVSHSGSIAMSMMTDVRRFGFSYAISSGNEAVLDAADYIDYLAEDEATKVIAMFIEAVRRPQRFLGALERAAEAGKPVVILKVGKVDRSRQAILSHTGGLASTHEVFARVVAAHGAIEVSDLNGLTEVLAAFQTSRRVTGARHVVLTASGGQAELALDIAEAGGTQLPPMQAETRKAVESRVGRITGDGNPADAWGLTGNFGNDLPGVLDDLNAASEFDNIVLCRDTAEHQPFPNNDRIVAEFAASAQRHSKPHFVLGMRSGLMHPANVAMLRAAGVPIVTGLKEGLHAIDLVARFHQQRPPIRQQGAGGGMKMADLAGTGRARATIHEADAKKILASHGIPVTRELVVGTLDAARTAAETIGYPVVLKVLSDDIPHKSDHGLVAVGIRDPESLDARWAAMQESLSRMDLPRSSYAFVVQEMVASGVEVFAGIKRDPDFGPVLAFGAGGVAIELFKDFALRPLPLREGDAEAMIAETQAAKLLAAHRGQPAADVESLSDILYRLSNYAMAEGDRVAEIDINPIKVFSKGQGCKVVDALIVPAAEASSGDR